MAAAAAPLAGKPSSTANDALTSLKRKRNGLQLLASPPDSEPRTAALPFKSQNILPFGRKKTFFAHSCPGKDVHRMMSAARSQLKRKADCDHDFDDEDDDFDIPADLFDNIMATVARTPVPPSRDSDAGTGTVTAAPAAGAQQFQVQAAHTPLLTPGFTKASTAAEFDSSTKLIPKSPGKQLSKAAERNEDGETFFLVKSYSGECPVRAMCAVVQWLSAGRSLMPTGLPVPAHECQTAVIDNASCNVEDV